MAVSSISDAEWQVMNVVWEGQPMTGQEIVSELADQTEWASATIKTMLHRLVKKKVLSFEQQGNRYLYRSRVRKSNCVKQASQSFLQRVFSSEAAPLLAYFLKNTKLSEQEIADLRDMLNEQEAQS